MEKDLYVGSLSRYYTQNWFEDLEPADSDLTPAEIQKITSGWRDSVMQAIQPTVGKREGWEERLDGPFRLAKLEEPAVDALLLYAAAKMYNEPYPGRLPLDWNPDDEPLIQRAKADEQANWSLFRNAEWWLPVEQPLLFQGETPTGDMITLSTAGALMLELLRLNEAVLETVYPTRTAADETPVPVLSAPAVSRVAPKVGVAVPRVLIPVFPGTNCEYDSARAVRRAGLAPEILVMNNQSPQGVADSVSRFAQAARKSQIIFVPGGFSGGDEPDGSAKFITAFFRNPEVRDATMDLLKNRDGLMLGICNGFQALIKLGLVPFGEIIDTDDACPTLTFNTISRHQSRLVRTRIASNKSPWLAGTEVGDVYTVPISHGEGRFLCRPELLEKLAANGQITTQYVDLNGVPGMDVDVNPNGSAWAVEGITSPDGRVLGKMGHSERIADGIHRNVSGVYDMKLFASAKKYFD